MSMAAEQVLNPEKIAAELGPFARPDSFEFEAELLPATPRPVPGRLRRGPYEAKWSQGISAALTVGVVCVGLSFLSFVKELGYYILPLGYFNWIGYGIIALTALAYLLNRLRPGRFEYVRSGLPLVARVLQSGRQLDAYEAKELKFLSLLEYKHPETNRLSYTAVASPTVGAIFNPDAYTTTLEAGDYVTAVYLPGRLDKSLQVYGYLGLNPDAAFIRKDGRRIREHVSLWKTFAIIGLIVVVLGLLVAGLYTIEFRFPIEFNPWHFAVPVAGSGVVFAVAALLASLRKRGDKKKGLRASLKIFIAGGVGGVFLAGILLPLLNSFVDRGEPQFRDIEVVEFWQETWDFLIRNYKIEYRELGQAKSRKCPSTIEQMAHFQQMLAGVIEVRKGLFGWSWVSDICPAVLVQVTAEGRIEMLSPEAVEEFAAGKFDAGASALSMAVMLDEDEFMPLSDKLQQHLMSEMARTEKER
jgi:hypothetical protein